MLMNERLCIFLLDSYFTAIGPLSATFQSLMTNLISLHAAFVHSSVYHNCCWITNVLGGSAASQVLISDLDIKSVENLKQVDRYWQQDDASHDIVINEIDDRLNNERDSERSHLFVISLKFKSM